MGLPGVKVGPLDPDRTEAFGQVAGKNSARQLIRLHAQSHPVALQNALVRKLDDERSKALDMDEVRDYLASLDLENGDPAVPEGAEVVGASVRGERDQTQQLTYTYKVAGSGRTAKWFAEYNEDVLPDSFDAGSERVHVAEMKERGVVISDRDAGASASREASENKELRKKLRALQAQLDEATTALDDRAGAPAGGDGADDDDDGAAKEVSSAQDEPFDGYDDMNAASVVKLIKSKDTSDEEIQAVLDYEKVHANRKGVVGAAEQTLGARGAAE
jgi:hypothetical protein